MRRSNRNLLYVVTALLTAGSALAQIDPRLTGASIIAQLEAAQRDLAPRATALSDSGLVSGTVKDLDTITEDLRKAVSNGAAKPIDKLGDEPKGRALRAYAAVQRTQAWLAAAGACTDGDAATMASALNASVGRIVKAKDSGKDAQPAIYGVETLDHRPLFAVRNDAKDVAFALTGVNLHDAQCEDPLVTATDDQGVAMTTQPIITGVLPNRIELKLPSDVTAGTYVLHVVPKKKARFLGCSAQPEATAAIQIAPPVKFSIAYTVTATCRVRDGKKGTAERAQAPVSGTLPDLTAYGATVSQQVAVAACEDPVSYAISAKATFGDGSSRSIGPINQSAAAGITAGIPGGLSFSWDPTVHSIFVTAAANACKGFY